MQVFNGFGPLAQNAGTGQVAAGRVLMYARTSTCICMDGYLYCMDGCLYIAWTGAYILHGQVLIYCMDGYLYCMDGYLYIAWTGTYILHGRVLILHER